MYTVLIHVRLLQTQHLATRTTGLKPKKRATRKRKRTAGKAEDLKIAQQEAERNRMLQEDIKQYYFLYREIREEAYNPSIKRIQVRTTLSIAVHLYTNNLEQGEEYTAYSIEYIAAKQTFSEQTRNHKRTTIKNCIVIIPNLSLSTALVRSTQ